MLNARLLRWAAWAPGLETLESWHAWARDPVPIVAEGQPEARFLPPLLRRRCTPLTRIMLTAAFACCAEKERGEVRSVFASRHGSINESIEMLEAIAEEKPLSPAKFSHTVHNAQAGLFSIAANNRRASSSLAAQEDTFGCGYLEALAHLEREPARPVLLVMGDVPLAETFAHLIDEPPASYALALLLAATDSGAPVAEDEMLAFEWRTGDVIAPKPWPAALEFLRWWLIGAESELALGLRRCRWVWQRPFNPDYS